MKASILMLFATLSISLAGQQFQTGSYLYVNAHSGLNLRKSPAADGEILALLPFGRKVLIQSIPEDTVKIGSTEGQWLQVQTDGKSGYVFDYFLTSLPVFRPAEISNCDYPALVKYMLSQFNVEDSTFYHNGIDGQPRHVMKIYDTKNGHQLIEHTYWESFELEIQLKKVRQSEVFQLLKNFKEFCDKPLERPLQIGRQQSYLLKELCCDMDIVKTYDNRFIIRLRGGP